MNQTINHNEYPWLLFKIHGIEYAVSSKLITAITNISDDLIDIPDKVDYIRGISPFRGATIKLIDMRKIFSVDSIEAEYQHFIEIIDHAKSDHVKWINALENTVKTGVPFTLSTDSDNCAFGKWLSRFKSDINAINKHLESINPPHQELHSLGSKVMNYMQNNEDGHNTKYIDEILFHAKEDLVPLILKLLDEAKDLFKPHINEMVIVFEHKDKCIGIIIDEVLSVDEIEFLRSPFDTKTVFKNDFILGMGKTLKSSESVLLLNETSLLNTVK